MGQSRCKQYVAAAVCVTIQRLLLTSLPVPSNLAVYPAALGLISTFSARAFLSEDAANNEEWKLLATRYVAVTIDYIQALKRWPGCLRPLVYKYVPGYASIQSERATARQIIGDTLLRREGLSGGMHLSEPPSMLDYLCLANRRRENGLTSGEDDLNTMVDIQMVLAVAGIHTTSSSLAQCMLDFAYHYEQGREVAHEVRTIMHEHDGVLHQEALMSMKKLDSWIKESLRLHGPDLSKLAHAPVVADHTVPILATTLTQPL